MSISASPSCTCTSKRLVKNGVELTISGYNSGDKASSPAEVRKLTPAIAANAPRLLELLLPPTSGAKVTLVAYSLGMLKATTNATMTAMPHALNINLRPAHTFWASSIKSISCSSGFCGETTCCFISSFIVCHALYLNRFTKVAIMVANDAADVPIPMISAGDILFRLSFVGTIISHPGSIALELLDLGRATVPFI